MKLYIRVVPDVAKLLKNKMFSVSYRNNCLASLLIDTQNLVLKLYNLVQRSVFS